MLAGDTRQWLSGDFMLFLPNEIVDKICSYLTPQELSCAACCSTHWRERANSNILWKAFCRQQQWLQFGESSTQIKSLFTSTPPSVAPQSSFTSPTFHPIENTCKGFPSMCKWKDIYIRASHLHDNWLQGRYVVLPSLRGHKAKINCMDCSENVLASGGEDKLVILWDILTAKSFHVFDHHSDAVTCLKMKDSVLVSGCADGVIRIFNISTVKCIGHLCIPEGEIVSAVKFLHFDGTKAVCSYDDYTLRIWHVITGKCLYVLSGHTDELVHLSCYGRYILTAAWDETMRVWDADEGISVYTLLGHTEVVHCCKINDEYVVSGGGDKVIKIWLMSTGKCIQTLVGHNDDIYCIDFNEECIASGSADSNIIIWNWLGKQMYVLKEHIGVVRCLKLRHDVLISCGDRKKVMVWDVKLGKLLNIVHRNPSLINIMWIDDTRLILAPPSSPGVISAISYW